MSQRREQYTWSEFVAAVVGLLGVDSDREGIDDYRLGQLRQAVIQLQNLVPKYRSGHEAIYLPQDLVWEGCASRGAKPPESVIRDIWLFKVATTTTTVGGVTLRVPTKGPYGQRFATERFDYARRFELVNGAVPLNDGVGKVAVDPYGYTFYVYPEIKDEWLVSMFWDGVKLDFQDEESTPFDEKMAGAVALFVKGQIAREVEKDLQSYESYMREWTQAKPRLFAAAREQG